MATRDESKCCPPFEPVKWDDVIIEWNSKKFIKDKVCTVYYMPINFGVAMRRLDSKVRGANANVPDWLCLSDHTSKWNMDVYLAIDKEVPGTENVELSGKFYSKVYEGKFSETAKWCKDFEKRAKLKDLNIKKWYMWYTTCPKCAKRYGKNYVAIIGFVE